MTSGTGLLGDLERNGRLVRYESNGQAFAIIPTFGAHQRINRPSPSRLPEPPEGLSESSVRPHGGLTAGKDQGSGNRDHGVRSDGGEGASSADDAAVVGLWHDLAGRAGLPACRGGTRVRKTIRARLKSNGWLDAYRAALAFIEGSEWHRGKNDRAWRANLEWLLRDGKAEELADKAAIGGPANGAPRPLPTLNGRGDIA